MYSRHDQLLSLGTWTEWSPWSACSASCGFGNITRNRTCDGTDCLGVDSETNPCIAPIPCTCT